ncbi:MAG: hypothetical protein OXP66_14175, partial [Candidatus Tectomicrobia bacterium]|nr:hypothetical protein [Candidatus Tectomicrobia bacterium]
ANAALVVEERQHGNGHASVSLAIRVKAPYCRLFSCRPTDAQLICNDKTANRSICLYAHKYKPSLTVSCQMVSKIADGFAYCD